ncbi:MAG TPA: hypothetical protein VI704_04225, partial [Bacteroidota bacterium]|nr:hypothetical protein [Bacteroidota bacterium]
MQWKKPLRKTKEIAKSRRNHAKDPPETEVVVEMEPAPPDTSAWHEREGDEDFISYPPKKEDSKPAWVGLRIGGGTLKAADFNGIGELGITLGTYFDDQIYGELWGYIGGSSLTGSSPLNKSITESVTFAGLGAEGKYFLTPSHTF